MSHTPDTSLSRRRWLSAGAGAVALPAWLPALSPGLLPAESFAQDGFPSRPIRIILPFPPGQATDIITRLMAERLGTLWKQTLIVDSRSGKLRVLAAATKERLPQLPEAPTIAESGFPGFEAAGWATVMLPAGTPAALISRISTDVQMVLREATLRDKIIERGSIPDPRTPAETAEFIRAEIEKWSRVAKLASVRLDQ